GNGGTLTPSPRPVRPDQVGEISCLPVHALRVATVSCTFRRNPRASLSVFLCSTPALTTPQLNSFTPPLLIPMKAAFFASPCFSVRNLYHVSHTLPCAPASGAANAIWTPRLSSSTSVCGSWSQ